MIEDRIDSLMDELTKIGVVLNKREQRKQDVQFALLGTVAAPLVSAATNMIGYGRPIPPGADPKRWLAASAFKGLVGGAALPIIRRKIESSNKAQARLHKTGG
jgi:hypothetical protein